MPKPSFTSSDCLHAPSSMTVFNTISSWRKYSDQAKGGWSCCRARNSVVESHPAKPAVSPPTDAAAPSRMPVRLVNKSGIRVALHAWVAGPRPNRSGCAGGARRTLLSRWARLKYGNQGISLRTPARHRKDILACGAAGTKRSRPLPHLPRLQDVRADPISAKSFPRDGATARLLG